MKYFYVYIMTNFHNTVLYVGVTNNLERRIFEHKNKINKDSFTSKYNINKLVFFESFVNINDAIEFEKRLKGGSRKKKIKLIEENNSEWKDLSLEW